MIDLTHEEWLEKEGGVEGPTHDETLEQECQKRRIEWLVNNSVGDVLEIGCNYGYIVAKAITKTGGEGVGVDINIENIKLARQMYAGRKDLYFFAMDITINWMMRKFDTVMLPDVLEHISLTKLENVLQNAAMTTKDRLMITLPWEEEKRHCFKHKWLVDDNMLDKIKEILCGYFCCVDVYCDGDFIYIFATDSALIRKQIVEYSSNMNRISDSITLKLCD